MAYNYKALVVDDMPQMVSICGTYKKYLTKESIDIEFTVINNEAEYDEKIPYDILLVDYNLTNGFFNSSKRLGNEFIDTFRKINKISKVIFYSSEFEYSITDKKYKFPFSDKETFDLINNLQVDKVVAKSNFEMMTQAIKECCEQIDVLPLVLSRAILEYSKNDITVSYTNIDGDDVDITSLLDDLINDNNEGKRFREQVIETILTVLFKYKY